MALNGFIDGQSRNIFGECCGVIKGVSECLVCEANVTRWLVLVTKISTYTFTAVVLFYVKTNKWTNSYIKLIIELMSI